MKSKIDIDSLTDGIVEDVFSLENVVFKEVENPLYDSTKHTKYYKTPEVPKLVQKKQEILTVEETIDDVLDSFDFTHTTDKTPVSGYIESITQKQEKIIPLTVEEMNNAKFDEIENKLQSISEANRKTFIAINSGAGAGIGVGSGGSGVGRREVEQIIASTGGGGGAPVVDDLLSTLPTSSLSAAQGKILKDEQVNIGALMGTTFGVTDLGTFTGTTIPDSRTIKVALQDLETALEAGISTTIVVDDLFSTSTTSVLSANQGRILRGYQTTVEIRSINSSNTIGTTSSGNLGTFTGTTITDASTIKVALQELETAVENVPQRKQEVVATIAARNALVASASGDIAYVTDATADATVSAGAALYVYDGTVWNKIAEFEGMDMSFAQTTHVFTDSATFNVDTGPFANNDIAVVNDASGDNNVGTGAARYIRQNTQWILFHADNDNKKNLNTYATIAARDINAGALNGDYVEVTDASGDPSVQAGMARYIYINGAYVLFYRDQSTVAPTIAVQTVADITARDAITTPAENQLVIVIDATADAFISTGAAYYLYKNGAYYIVYSDQEMTYIGNLYTQSGTALADLHYGTFTGTILTDDLTSKALFQEIEVELEALTSYTQTFDATTDWGTATTGVYTITILAATHNVTDPFVITILEDSGTAYIPILTEYEINKTTGDITFFAVETPDGRFAGKIKISA